MMGIRSEVCFYFPKRSRLSHDETHKKFVPHILRKSITLIYLSEMSEADMPLWDKLLFYYFLSSNYFYSGRKGKQFVQLLRFMIFFSFGFSFESFLFLWIIFANEQHKFWFIISLRDVRFYSITSRRGLDISYYFPSSRFFSWWS